jgi:Flp pilus assembly pilin Flp
MIDRIAVWALALKTKLSSERGQDMMEYALITGGIGIALVGALAIISPTLIESWFQGLADAISDSIIK